MCYVNQKHASGNFPTWQLADGEEGGVGRKVGWAGGLGKEGKKKKKALQFPGAKISRNKMFVYGDVYLLPLDPD